MLVSPRDQGGLGYSLKVLTVLAVQADQYERAIYRACLENVNDPAQFIFVDECSVGRNASRRRRGYGRRGRPVSGFEVFVGDDNPHLGPKHHFTLIGAVDINGFVSAACGRVRRKRRPNDTDPTRGTVDQERFYEYVVGTLVPTLGSYANGEPRSVVVMDNATVHKDPRVRVAIEAAGAVLIWNAAYSPDLNPIESVFSLYSTRRSCAGTVCHQISAAPRARAPPGTGRVRRPQEDVQLLQRQGVRGVLPERAGRAGAAGDRRGAGRGPRCAAPAEVKCESSVREKIII